MLVDEESLGESYGHRSFANDGFRAKKKAALVL